MPRSPWRSPPSSCSPRRPDDAALRGAYSGRHLALAEGAAALRTLTLLSLIVAVFVPYGVVTATGLPLLWPPAAIVWAAKLAVLAAALAAVAGGARRAVAGAAGGAPCRGTGAGAAGGDPAVRGTGLRVSLAAPAPWSALAVLLPLLASVAACLVPTPRAAWWLAVAGSTAALACTSGLVLSRAPPGLPAHVALLTAFVAAATAWTARDLARPQHALSLALLGALLAAVLTDQIGLTWLAMEAATLAGAALLGLTRGEAAASAGWRLLVLGGVGLGLALFGSVLLYLAAQPVLGRDRRR